MVTGAAVGGVLLGAAGFAVGWLLAMILFPSQGLDALAMIGLMTTLAGIFGLFIGAALAGRATRHGRP